MKTYRPVVYLSRAGWTVSRPAPAGGVASVVLCALLWIGSVVIASGAVPFYDGFDDPAYYGPGTNFVTPIRGWGSDIPDVQVVTNVYDTAAQSAAIPDPGMMTNGVGGVGGVVWTDFRVRPCFGVLPEIPVGGVASVMISFPESGCLAIATNSAWLLATHNVWGGTNGLALTTDVFTRVTIYQDFGRSNVAVFVNSNLVAQDLGFLGSAAALNLFRLNNSNGVGTAYLDTVSFSNGPPAIVADLNGDGLSDVQELAQYGYAMRSLVVATNGAYTNLQVAVNAARARDVIVVSNGTYAGAVTIDHAFATMTGGVFTLGPLAITGSGLAITSAVGFACGDLGISNGNRLVVGGNLTCGNVTTGTGTALRVTGSLACGTVALGSNSVLAAAGAITGSNTTLNAGSVLTAGGALGVSGDLSVGTNAVASAGGALTASNLTVSANGAVVANGALSVSNALSLGMGATASVTGSVTAASVALGDGAWLRSTGGLTAASVTLSTGAVLTAGGALGVSGDLSVGTNAVASVGGGLTAGNVALSAGAVLTAASLSVVGAATVDSAAVLTVGGQVVGSNVTVNGALRLGSGGSITCTNLTLGPGVSLNLTNATVNAANLLMDAAATVTITNGTLTANGAVLTGTFTVSGSDWNNPAAPSTLPFRDGFEQYGDGIPLSRYYFRGWGASSNSVVVTNGEAAAGTAQSAAVPGANVLSNRLNGSGWTKVWADFRIRPVLGEVEGSYAPTDRGAGMVYFSSNGYAVVYDSSKGWDECSSNAMGNAVTGLVSATTWARVTMCIDYAVWKSAFFLNGELLREQIPLGAGVATACSRFTLCNDETGTVSCLDEVFIGATPPVDLYGDINHDGMNDFTTIDLAGTIFIPRGTVFKFR